MTTKSLSTVEPAKSKKNVLATIIGREKFKQLDEESRPAVQLHQNDSAERAIWFDTNKFESMTDLDNVLNRLPQSGYSGIIVSMENLPKIAEKIAPGLAIVVELSGKEKNAGDLLSKVAVQGRQLVAASTSLKQLDALKAAGFLTCLRGYVDDAESLHSVIDNGIRHNFLTIKFKDPTNIPLELVIASLQKSKTVLLKDIQNDDLEDAVVSLGVMEFGADGVIFSSIRHDLIDQFKTHLNQIKTAAIKIEVATITEAKPVGMGYRGCIDLATIFSETEGMLIGSTSQGGFLACPEVFFLPYMELRPFRVNAGAVHSYIYGPRDRTAYMTELRAGSEVQIVGLDGRTRKATVGRVKTEMRPLRLLVAKFDSGESINILMQDDWHVRIFGEDGQPKNISELKAGDRVLAHPAETGRHVGIKISENIIEV